MLCLMIFSSSVNATTYQEEKEKTPQDLQKYFEDFNAKWSVEYVKNHFQQIIDDLNGFLHKYPNDNIVKLRILRLIALNYVDIEKFDDARYYLEAIKHYNESIN